jgi:sugar lactone lactonase YvrE
VSPAQIGPTPARPVELLGGGAFFESPRWHDGRWWASDMFAGRVVAASEGSSPEITSVPGQPSGLGWLPDGALLVVAMQEQAVLRIDGEGSTSSYADLSSHLVGPANDMLVDRAGRAWVGGLGFDLAAGADPQESVLVCIHPDGEVLVAAEGLMTPNGMAMTDDGHTLLVAETFAGRVSSFPVTSAGELGLRSTWAQLTAPPAPGPLRSVLSRLLAAPDGIALDAEGCLWVADAVGGKCLRVSAAGEILDAVSAPRGSRVFACALGGPDGHSLLLCCAPDAVQSRREAARESSLWTVSVSVAAG